ncbi:OprO/OprP family phosphate-selective porin [Geothrix sp. 21YS21S-2]|uniref:OprO/OprP family phosphate-selective porin n=1 Tax=Geothrix sp. 21YS21S-2 TaxID=3068893 RepID=UPI0027BA35E2|nr:porin [Geothrix sp. 21YS21S-2]
MKFFVTPLALAILAGPLAAQAPTDADKRIADLEKKVEKLTKLEAKKSDESKDGGFYVKFGGRFHLDSVFFDGNKNRLANGTQLRRGRISFKAGFGKDWVAEGDYDFAEGGASVKDMWVGYQGFKDTLIQVGQFKAPFGFDTLSSSNAIWFTERSYSDIWTPDRHVGVAVAKWGERWQAKANFFGQAIDDTNTADTNGSDHGWGYAGRVSVAPILVNESKAIHFGVAMNTRTPIADYSTTTLVPVAGEAYAIDFSGRPEAGKISKAKFLNAKVANVKNYTQTGAEFAGVWNAFSWQSEYQQTKVKRRDAFGTTAAALAASVVDHTFSTYYGQVSYIFGGRRSYSAQDGLFGKVTPSSKMGALEVVARYSKMNQDDLTAIDAVKGGQAKNMSLGLTWYTNKNIRWMADYTKVDNNENAKPKGVYGGIVNDDFSITTIRLQVNF